MSTYDPAIPVVWLVGEVGFDVVEPRRQQRPERGCCRPTDRAGLVTRDERVQHRLGVPTSASDGAAQLHALVREAVSGAVKPHLPVARSLLPLQRPWGDRGTNPTSSSGSRDNSALTSTNEVGRVGIEPTTKGL
jgi:hypothetical protein